MAQAQSSKRQQIEKSVSTMVIIASCALFALIFCLLSVHSLASKISFQSRVISADTTAKNQLQTDVGAANQLTNTYENFNDAKTNLLGQPVTGVDNDNAKIILDALPSKYDYPALTTSLENLLSNQGVNIDSIGGADEGATIGDSGSVPVDMPFTFTVDGPYQNIVNVINEFQSSIRPFQMQTIDLNGNQSDLTLTVTAQTFFQPATSFNITEGTVE